MQRCWSRPQRSASRKLIAWVCVAALAACAAWTDAAAECLDANRVSPPAPVVLGASTDASGPTTRDAAGRMVAPVLVAGRGPFRFIVDTGANRTALSRELARQLGLTPIGTGEVHSVHGVAVAPMVAAQMLNYGSLTLASRDMPLIEGAVLAGEAGLLGVDSMRDQRLRMDFERKCIEIESSEAPFRRAGWTAVHGEVRFGHLVVIRGRIRAQAVNILIDTGSDSTLANVALRDQLANQIRTTDLRGDTFARAYTMGEPVVLHSAILIPSMHIGGVEVDHVTAYVGDFHIFQLWDLVHEPTLLIGMDVLSQTRSIAIDFSRGSVYFRLRPRPTTGTRLPGRAPGNASTTITR